jgi:hypothetical protein
MLHLCAFTSQRFAIGPIPKGLDIGAHLVGFARVLSHGCQDQTPDVEHFLSRLAERGEKPEFRRAPVAVARAECALLAGK